MNKTYKNKYIALLLIVLMVSSLVPATAFGSNGDGGSVSPDFKEDEIICYAKKAAGSQVLEVIEDNDMEVVDKVSDHGNDIYQVKLSDDQSVGSAISTIEGESEGVFCQPNYIYKLADDEKKVTAESPSFGVTKDNWFLDKIKAFDARDYLSGGSGSGSGSDSGADSGAVSGGKVKVAVIDTGVDINHPNLKDTINIKDSARILDGKISKLKGDSDIHGTHVTGIIAGKYLPKKNWSGVATGYADVFVVDSSIKYDGEVSFETIDLVQALDYSIKKGAKVINMSIAGNGRDRVLEQKIEECIKKDIVVVAAAGNDDVSSYVNPSDISNVISVINSDYNDKKSISNYGVEKDISAPGEVIYSTIPGKRFMYSSGTSMAAPMVAAGAALVRYANPSLTNGQVKQILLSSSDDIDSHGFDVRTGFGRLNCLEAVKIAREPRDYMPTDLWLNKKKISLGVNLSTGIEYSFPNNKIDRSTALVEFSSKNPKIAKVNDRGVVTGIGEGTTEVILKIGNVTKSVKVSVYGPKYKAITKSPFGIRTKIKNSTNTSYYPRSDWYVYSGKKGEVIDMASDSLDFDTNMAVYDSNGDPIYFNTMTMDKIGNAQRLKFTLNKDQKIYIEVFDYEGYSKLREYTLKLVSSKTKVSLGAKKPSPKEVVLSWKPVSNQEGVCIYRSSSKNSGYKLVKVVKGRKASSATLKLNSKEKDKKYYYKAKIYKTYFGNRRIYGGYSNYKYI